MFATAIASFALASGAFAQGTSAPPEQNRFTRTILLEGIDEPIEIEFDRSGRVYFIERKGAVKRYDEQTGQVEQDVDPGTTHPVGGKKPNAWGLHDTLGNVWEWVGDFYNEKVFPDRVPPTAGTTHVLKGGSFLSDVKNATWSTHAGGPGSGLDVGCRVVREVP